MNPEATQPASEPVIEMVPFADKARAIIVPKEPAPENRTMVDDIDRAAILANVVAMYDSPDFSDDDRAEALAEISASTFEELRARYFAADTKISIEDAKKALGKSHDTPEEIAA